MRSIARETIFKIIYKSFFLNGDLSFEEMLEEDSITSDKDKDFAEDYKFIEEIISLYKTNSEKINELINKNVKGYTPERVYKIDRAILATAITELLFYKLTPLKVVVNEAVEMAKKYSTEKSFSFVNGILKSVLEDVNVN